MHPVRAMDVEKAGLAGSGGQPAAVSCMYPMVQKYHRAIIASTGNCSASYISGVGDVGFCVTVGFRDYSHILVFNSSRGEAVWRLAPRKRKNVQLKWNTYYSFINIHHSLHKPILVQQGVQDSPGFVGYYSLISISNQHVLRYPLGYRT